MVHAFGAKDLDARSVLTQYSVLPDGVLGSVTEALWEQGGVVAGNNAAGDGDDTPLQFAAAAQKALDDAVAFVRQMNLAADGTVMSGHRPCAAGGAEV